MSFYADPSFFILLIAAVIPAAVLGLAEKPLGRYGAVASVILIACLFCKTPLEGFYAACYLTLSCASIQWLLRSPASKKRFWVSLSLALAPLIVYKVSAVFDQSLLGFLGISYLTFKSVQMVLEIHDGIIDRMAPLDTFAFLVFFPTFTSGPIDRSRRFLEDAHAVRPKDEYAGMLARGILLIVAGLVYKLFIAGLMYKSYSLAPWGTADFFWELFLQVKTAYVYGFYLFFDFAGYSLMAIGASWCFGIKTPRNFRAPFIAVDIKDFWNRWHMTLSFWLRDFVFMRFARASMKRKLFKKRLHTSLCGYLVNMTLMGAWHGLTPNYLAYGAYHGALLALCELYQKKSSFYKKNKDRTWYKVLSWIVTIQLVMLGFALFSGQISVLLKGR
ncbi:D-alanyl-lipoteichoic acid biosynthesis protein DltB [Gordonibacter sp. Marseille-P4307]|uniref:D-alanyl-lipoteichoic acid biosynthesis protein DltB n=1 Tax=Gordonibacter sp. Marseille-P4307 TaxID=2161815 RepID=UPI000F533D20|nr:D-alanyl-lipoteichoic acid biosynthesis protein DltB [Gordonibacter sp. Marseille-P4307]